MIRMTYELVNEHEAECGDTDRRGWLDRHGFFNTDPEEMSLRDALDLLPFIVQAEWQVGTLVLTGNTEQHDDGDWETRTAHMRVTPSTANRILRLIKRQRRGWNFPAVN
jgi:hypothetical protein